MSLTLHLLRDYLPGEYGLAGSMPDEVKNRPVELVSCNSQEAGKNFGKTPLQGEYCLL